MPHLADFLPLIKYRVSEVVPTLWEDVYGKDTKYWDYSDSPIFATVLATVEGEIVQAYLCINFDEGEYAWMSPKIKQAYENKMRYHGVEEKYKYLDTYEEFFELLKKAIENTSDPSKWRGELSGGY